MCYLLNAFSCTNWHIWKKLRKYIFMFTWLKVVPTIKIGMHTGPLCHVKNVTFWKFSWYCEKTRWKALYFYMINMICMMCVFIWIFTQLHFYLIDDSYVGQKYGIEFSCQFRCRNMSCEITLRPRQNGRHFPDDIFNSIFLNENVWTPIKFSLTFVPKGPINNILALVQIMAWRRLGDKPLSEPMIVRLPTHIMRHSASMS